MPAGGYFIFGYKNPDPAPMWTGFGGKPVTIYQNGTEAGTVRVDRKDGPGRRRGLQSVRPDRHQRDRLLLFHRPAAGDQRHQPQLRRARGRLGRQRA